VMPRGDGAVGHVQGLTDGVLFVSAGANVGVS